MNEPQHVVALEAGNARRLEWAKIRAELRRDPEAVRRVLVDPPESIGDRTVAELLALARHRGLRAKSMRQLGHLAVRDKINLFVPVGEASARTRAWAAEHGTMWVSARRSDSRRNRVAA